MTLRKSIEAFHKHRDTVVFVGVVAMVTGFLAWTI